MLPSRGERSSDRRTVINKVKRMQDAWIKPAAQECSVNGECTAYAGVDAAQMMAQETPAVTANSEAD